MVLDVHNPLSGREDAQRSDSEGSSERNVTESLVCSLLDFHGR